MDKQVLEYKDIRDRIIKGVDTIANPIKETLSPKGRNVIYEDGGGNFFSTNDGVSIAKTITVKDPVENAVISIIRGSSLKTNSETGDGTSTSIMLSQVLIKEGLKLVDAGWNQMDVKREYLKFGEITTQSLKKMSVNVKSDNDLLKIATVSANNDEEIAKDVVRTIKVAGLDGMVFLEPNNKPQTEIIEDTGFHIPAGMLSPELRGKDGKNHIGYLNVPVLITDKRIYYQEEAETILKTVLIAGHKSVVVVARDFIGQSVNTFMANHMKGTCNILLIKDPNATEKNSETLYDLAVYLGGKVITEKTGSLVNKLTIDDFIMADKAYSDFTKTLISTRKKKNKELDVRVSELKKEIEKDKENDTLKKRVAAMTNGMVTLKIGGKTVIEVRERLFRYEDAVNATRAAMRDGVLVGGGVSLRNVLNGSKFPQDLTPVFRKFCEASLRQIVENCGGHPDTIIKKISESPSKNWGYNAITGEVEDLLKAGILDPYKVVEMSVVNSISVANEIISSNFMVLFDKEAADKKNE